MPVRKVAAVLVLVLLAAAPLTGCHGPYEADDIAVALAMGIDKAEGDAIRVTYQLAVPKSSDSGDGGQSGPTDSRNSEIITLTAPTLAETRNLANSVIPLAINLTHVKAIIVGEEMARSGLGQILGPIMRYREYRGSIFVLVAKGTAENFIRKNQTQFALSPSKYYEIILQSARETGYYLPVTLHEFYIRLKSYAAAPYATYIAVQDGELSPQAAEGPGNKSPAYRAGEVPHTGGNPVDFSGTAVFDGDKMVGTLTNQETSALAILQNEFTRGFVSVVDPLNPQQPVNILMRAGRAPKFRVAMEGEKISVDVDILLEGEITSVPSGISYENTKFRTLLEEEIAQLFEGQINRTIHKTQAWNADVAGFGFRLLPKFRTFVDFQDFQWHDKYSQADIHAHVTVKLRRSGLMWRTTLTT